MSERDYFDLTPQQYHAGLDKLWAALGIKEVQDEDVFTLAARRIMDLKAENRRLNAMGDEIFGSGIELSDE